MKNALKLFAIAVAITTFSACAGKEKEPEETVPVEETTTTQSEDGSSVTIEAGDKGGKVEVETKEGTNVEVDIDKKGGSVTVEDDGNKVDVKIKDDDKK